LRSISRINSNDHPEYVFPPVSGGLHYGTMPGPPKTGAFLVFPPLGGLHCGTRFVVPPVTPVTSAPAGQRRLY
jgi:hypothetical protein